MLSKTFKGDGEKMKERASHVHDSPHIVKLNASLATFNATRGKDTRHQDCMNMAAQKYISILSNGEDCKNLKVFMKQKKLIVRFRAEINKCVTQKELEQEKKPQTKTTNMENNVFMQRRLDGRT